MKKEYKVYVSDAYYICKDGICDWASEVDSSIPEFTNKHVETHSSLAEALESMSEWGSKWVMFSSVTVETEEDGEVYSSYPALTKCACCKHEEWDSIESNLAEMKNKKGEKLFPDIN